MKSSNAIRSEVELLNRMSEDAGETMDRDHLAEAVMSAMCLGAALALKWITGGPPPSTTIQQHIAELVKRHPAASESPNE